MNTSGAASCLLAALALWAMAQALAGAAPPEDARDAAPTEAIHPAKPTENRLAGEAARLRDELRRLKAEREATVRDRMPIAIEASGMAPMTTPRGAALLIIENDMDRWRAVCILEPEAGVEPRNGAGAASAGSNSEPVSAQGVASAALRVPILLKGAQPLALAAGRWSFKAFAAPPPGGDEIELAAEPLELAAGRAYVVRFDEAFEQRLQAAARARERERRTQDGKARAPGQPPGPDAQDRESQPATPSSPESPLPPTPLQ